MSITFKRRRNVDRATLFKAIYVNPSEDVNIRYEREFKSLKSMNQWISRGDFFECAILGRLAKIDDTWETFEIIGKKCLTLSELNLIISNLEQVQP